MNESINQSMSSGVTHGWVGGWVGGTYRDLPNVRFRVDVEGGEGFPLVLDGFLLEEVGGSLFYGCIQCIPGWVGKWVGGGGAGGSNDAVCMDWVGGWVGERRVYSLLTVGRCLPKRGSSQ